jgi:hypothetical protein
VVRVPESVGHGLRGILCVLRVQVFGAEGFVVLFDAGVHCRAHRATHVRCEPQRRQWVEVRVRMESVNGDRRGLHAPEYISERLAPLWQLALEQ